MEERILRRREVLNMLGISSATLHRRLKDGSIQQPLRLGPNSVGWKKTYIMAVIDGFQTATPVEVAPGVRKGRKSRNVVEAGV